MKEYIDKCQNTEKCLKSTVVVMLRHCESQLIRAARISSTPHHWLQLSTETHSPGAELQNTSTFIHFSWSWEVSRVSIPILLWCWILKVSPQWLLFLRWNQRVKGETLHILTVLTPPLAKMWHVMLVLRAIIRINIAFANKHLIKL